MRKHDKNRKNIKIDLEDGSVSNALFKALYEIFKMNNSSNIKEKLNNNVQGYVYIFRSSTGGSVYVGWSKDYVGTEHGANYYEQFFADDSEIITAREFLRKLSFCNTRFNL